MQRPFLVMALVLCAACAGESADSVSQSSDCEAKEGGGAEIRNAWVRPAAEGRVMTAAYFSLCNGGAQPLVIIGAETAEANAAELHETVRENDIASMRRIERLEAAPGEMIEFEAGGLHLMLMGLSRPIPAGATTEIALIFESGEKAVFTAEALEATGHGAHSHH